MTEVEFSILIAKLTANAKILNSESDSINDVIKAFEDKLREINLGLDVWLEDDPIESETLYEDDHRGERYESGNRDTELGLTKLGEVWHLALRDAVYKKEFDYNDNECGLALKDVEATTPLLQCTRKFRIEAIKRFPKLAEAMNAAAENAIGAIAAAKQLVK